MFLQISGRLLTPLNYSSALSNNNNGTKKMINFFSTAFIVISLLLISLSFQITVV